MGDVSLVLEAVFETDVITCVHRVRPASVTLPNHRPGQQTVCTATGGLLCNKAFSSFFSFLGLTWSKPALNLL